MSGGVGWEGGGGVLKYDVVQGGVWKYFPGGGGVNACPGGEGGGGGGYNIRLSRGGATK